MITTHISNAWDGAIVMFPASAVYWMKTCTRDGIGGVVNLNNGLYIYVKELDRYGLGNKVTIVAKNLDDLYREEED